MQEQREKGRSCQFFKHIKMPKRIKITKFIRNHGEAKKKKK